MTNIPTLAMQIVRILVALSSHTSALQTHISLPILAVEGNDNYVCPPREELQAVLDKLRNNISDKLESVTIPNTSPCGPGNWRLHFYLNMSEPSQSCPSEWTLVTNPDRACTGTNHSCVSAYTSPGEPAYSQVCGRLFGIGFGLSDGFFRHSNNGSGSIEMNYLDGVSITYGPAGSRSHVWSLGYGHTHRCPCDRNSTEYEAPLPPTEVGENYFCTAIPLDFNSETPLWQGSNCSTTNDPCCSFHDPPIFKVQLSAMTNEAMELRICKDEGSGDERLNLISVELYVQ